MEDNVKIIENTLDNFDLNILRNEYKSKNIFKDVD